MRLVTFLSEHGQRLGAVEGNAVVDLEHWAQQLGITLPRTMLEVIDTGEQGLDAVRRVVAAAPKSAAPGTPGVLPLSGARLRAPIPAPRRNIICLGRNYLEHALESAAARGQSTPPPA